MSTWRSAFPAGVLALACAVVAIATTPAAKPLPTATPAVVPARLLGDLTVGTNVAGWRVTAIGGEDDGGIRIELARDDVRFAISVVELGLRDETPFVATERHAIYYGHVIPADARVPDNAVRATTANIERRVRAAE